MLGRSIFQLGVCCLVLCACACKGNYPKKTPCAADGGCAESAKCEGKSCSDAATPHDEGGSAAAGSGARSRTQAAQVTKDAGASSKMGEDAKQDEKQDAKQDGGPAQPEMSSKQKNQGAGGSSAANSGKKGGKPGPSSAGAGGEAMKPAQKEQAGQGGASAEAGAGGAAQDEPSGDKAKAACEPTCGPCQACGDDNKTCQPVTGRDDADSCSDTRSCSSRGECLHISEAQAELGDMQDNVELKQSYAQVVTFSDPATIQEIRLEVSCSDSDQAFPAVWLAAAPGGIPSDTILATANVVAQAPTDHNAFAVLELSKALEEPAAGPIAIVVSQSDMSCIIRRNTQTPYRNGALFTQAATLWTPIEGSMVFQVLSSQ